MLGKRVSESQKHIKVSPLAIPPPSSHHHCPSSSSSPDESLLCGRCQKGKKMHDVTWKEERRNRQRETGGGILSDDEWEGRIFSLHATSQPASLTEKRISPSAESRLTRLTCNLFSLVFV